jgi:hypothetical protein
VLRGLRRRLERLWAVHQWERAAEDEQREAAGVRNRFLAVLRAGLARAGIDPASLPVMRRFDEPEDAPPATAARPPHPFDKLYGELSRLARGGCGSPAELANASAMTLFALYCFDEAAGPDGLARALA